MLASCVFRVSRGVSVVARTAARCRGGCSSPSLRFVLPTNTASMCVRAFATSQEGEKIVSNATKEVAKEATQTVVQPESSALKRNLAGFTVGVVASALGSMVGLGGGFIIIPLLTTFGGMTQHQAASCSLVSIFATALTGTGTYISQGLIDIPAAAAITVTSMIMARYGSKWSHNFESKKLKRYYGLLCLLVAPLLPIKTRIMEKRKEQEAQKKAQEVSSNLAEENAKLGYRDCLSMEAMKQSEVVEHSPLLLSLGLVAGTMSGFFGVGGGIIVSPSLCLFTQMAPKKIMGTSLASMIIPTSISAHLSYKKGNLVLGTALPICLGSVVGGVIGSKIAGKMPAKKIQWVLVALLLVSGLRSVLSSVC